MKAVFADGSTWDASTMTAQQWRLMPARRAQPWQERGKCVGWESMPCLTTSLRYSSDVKVDVPTLLCCSSRPNKFANALTLRSVTGKGDAEEQARKNAEELMTNVAKKFATSSIGRSDLFSYRNDLLKADGWTKEEAVEKRPP